MNLQEAKAIAQKVMEGMATPAEKNELQVFINNYPDKDELKAKLFPYQDRNRDQQLPPGMENRMLEKILGHPVMERAQEAQVIPLATNTKRRRIRQFIRFGAAAVIIGASLSIWMFLSSRQSHSGGMAGRYVTILTNDGQAKNIVLEDGTHIILNGGTSLRFREDFATGSREVYLDGEAFFDVAKDSTRPFTIHSPLITTTVLGTSFSIRSASGKDQLSEISVATGKIRVELNDPAFTDPAATAANAKSSVAGHLPAVTVSPGQAAVYRSGDQEGLHKKPVNISGIGAWKDHWFYYDQTPLKEILSDLTRSYGLHFLVKDTVVLNCTYSATFKNLPASSVLQTLTLMGHVNFSKKDSCIEVTGNACQ